MHPMLKLLSKKFFTMVSAGLAGVAPHMVAASISALSRLLFEYHTQLRQPVLDDLVATVEMFLESNNREVVRSVLGFVKVAVVVLSADVLRPRMPKLIPGLMIWSKENKGRPKNQSQRYNREVHPPNLASEDVEKWVGTENRKMVVNIRKKRERNKRNKKAVGEDESGSEEEAASGRKFDNEYDQAVFGSDEDDSDASDDIDKDRPRQATDQRTTKARDKQQYIHEDSDDEPLDLLDPKSLANVSSKRYSRVQLQSEPKKSEAKVNEDGKLVFGKDSDLNEDDNDILMDGADGADAYATAVAGPDAVKRGQKNRLKVGSGNQKRLKAQGQKLDLSEDEAREVVRKIMAGSASPREARPAARQRKGLGIEKRRDGPQNRGDPRRDARRGSNRSRGANVRFRGRGVRR